MNSHEHCLGLAQDYYAGRLDAAARGAWESHRDACPDCRAVLERWPHAEPVPDLQRAVLAAVRPKPSGAVPARTSAERGPAWLVPLAAALALAVLVAAFWHPERQWLRDDERGYGDTCQLQVKGGHPCCAD
jgi:hypothetical protein